MPPRPAHFGDAPEGHAQSSTHPPSNASAWKFRCRCSADPKRCATAMLSAFRAASHRTAPARFGPVESKRGSLSPATAGVDLRTRRCGGPRRSQRRLGVGRQWFCGAVLSAAGCNRSRVGIPLVSGHGPEGGWCSFLRCRRLHSTPCQGQGRERFPLLRVLPTRIVFALALEWLRADL